MNGKVECGDCDCINCADNCIYVVSKSVNENNHFHIQIGISFCAKFYHVEWRAANWNLIKRNVTMRQLSLVCACVCVYDDTAPRNDDVIFRAATSRYNPWIRKVLTRIAFGQSKLKIVRLLCTIVSVRSPSSVSFRWVVSSKFFFHMVIHSPFYFALRSGVEWPMTWGQKEKREKLFVKSKTKNKTKLEHNTSFNFGCAFSEFQEANHHHHHYRRSQHHTPHTAFLF